jgi:hypothetical protein
MSKKQALVRHWFKELTPREARRKKAREEKKNGKGSIRHRN